MIDQEGIAFLDRFLDDEENYYKVSHSAASFKESEEAFEKYLSHFAFDSRDSDFLSRDPDNRRWITYAEEVITTKRRLLVFMIRQFKKGERAIFQYYLGVKQKLVREMFGQMLFAEKTKDGFKITSRYDWINTWDIPDSADKNDEMSYWKLSDGEHLQQRGTLIATVRYLEPWKEDQKRVYFMEP